MKKRFDQDQLTVCNMTISRRGDRWVASVVVEDTSYGYIDLSTGKLHSTSSLAEDGAKQLVDILMSELGVTHEASDDEFEGFDSDVNEDQDEDLALISPGTHIAHSRGESYKQGLLGEQRTALELLSLERRGWRTLHSVPLTDTKDIDHLLIGPAGVFAVNTKLTDYPVEYRDPSVYVGGYRKDWRENQLHTTTACEGKLGGATGMDISVESLVVVWSPIAPTGADWLVHGEQLTEYLSTFPHVLDPALVEYMYSQARKKTTWI